MHAAAITKMWEKDSSIFYKVNVEGTRTLLDAALVCGVHKFIYTSSCAVIGPSDKYPMSENDPRITSFENDYEISKHLAEELVKEYSRRGLFAIIVAPPRVYGPGIEAGGNVFEKFLQKIINMGIAFVPSSDKVLANYGFVDDIINGHFLALKNGLGGEKYILGGENISYNIFFKTIKENTDKKIRMIRIPKIILLIWSFFHMILFRMMGKHTNISPKIIHRIAQNRALSCEKAVRQLGYTITPFSQGMQRTILHLQNKKYE
jgi:nucleoside-diphosphate-sugar epimerase